ncbi:hypothetical protein QPL79_05500 [Ignisphaera sp. 4213-co]|uniref:Uncharacterized protein n=1 Tax=Ignisphaera cupida TaxID=3050454 RepID=A0ABD4Z7B5_9CREN|nr:hypothetical protein [Ignisphaera sp. 4213-co]MDK6028813.1 hypothetical protein [Ignisphaera sp. 4213-co]
MSEKAPSPKIRKAQFIAYLATGIFLAAISILFMLWSVGYMERAYVGTSLISALIGFTLLSASLYVLRLSAYVYAVEKEEKRE